MPVIGCAILPHGSMVLDPEREGLPEGVAEITNGCRAVGECVAAWEPELVVLLTPHGLSASKSPRPGIYMTPSATGTAEWKEQYKEYEMSIRIDVDAAQNFLHHLGTYGVACVKITGTEAPLYRSEIVPLWFLRTLATVRRPPKFMIVSLPTPVGGTSVIRSAVAKDRIEDNLVFGQHLHRFLTWCPQRVAVVLSGDLAHTHATACTNQLYLPDPAWRLPISDAAAVFDAMIEK
ncbi:hypothetical protein HK104_000194 [Borealophlyctis nickersoniae]|nr:hypothetical protein HK104_000194 [Borealophlyctis nickersoniae]